MPPLRALEPPHDGAVLLLKPLSGVFDTVSRSHFDRSRMAARLKSRFALDAGVDFLSRLLERAESEWYEFRRRHGRCAARQRAAS